MVEEQIIVQTQKQREAELKQYYQQGWTQGREELKQYLKEQLADLELVKFKYQQLQEKLHEQFILNKTRTKTINETQEEKL